MGCGHCACGHHHDKNPHGPKSPLAMIVGGVLLGVAVLVGAAVALQPEDKPAPKPTPATPPAKAVQPAPPPAQTGKPAEEKPAEKGAAASPGKYVLGYEMKRIDGGAQKLDEYKGKVVLIVNVASKCGNTKQYAALEKLYQEKKDAGLVVLGFPANNFGGQEPGTNKEIAEFCSSKFSVTFPMFEKISVKGDDAHALYKQLASQPEPVGGEPDWNFAKYLVDRDGNAVAHFKARTKPDDAELVKKIDELLAAKK